MEARREFIRDSLLAREQHVKDSLFRKKRMLDSVNILKNQLQPLLEAYFASLKEDIVIRYYPIPVQGDTVLGEFSFLLLPFGVMDPYTPWKGKAVLSGKQVRYTYDQSRQRIIGIQCPGVKASFAYVDRGSVLIMEQPGMVQNNTYGHFYKKPVDSVYFDQNRKISRIKKYMLFYTLVNGNHCGQFLFTNRTQVKQYEYGQGGALVHYQITRYCDRWKIYEQNKVCSILNFTFTRQGNTYMVDRRNNPANNYSDGTYTFVTNEKDNLSSVAFQNQAKTENWKREIELNKDGNVNCYIDKANEVVKQSLCMIYHIEANARYPVETITTTFEKDGISYFQRNNTTGQIRTRDKMTLEWSPWKAE